jgi:hypothetical protein
VDDAPDARKVKQLAARATLGERLTPDEAHLVLKAESWETLQLVMGKIRGLDARAAVDVLLRELVVLVTAARSAQYEKRWAMENRIADLERTIVGATDVAALSDRIRTVEIMSRALRHLVPKPRARVKAKSRRTS